MQTVKVRSVANEVIFCHLVTNIYKISQDYTWLISQGFFFIIKHDIAPRG